MFAQRTHRTQRTITLRDVDDVADVAAVAAQVKMLMDLVCKSCGELKDDAVKKNLRIRVLSSDTSNVGDVDGRSILSLSSKRPLIE